MKRRRKNVVGNSFEKLEQKRLLAADVVMGDLNNDGSVNFQDFTILSGHFGKSDANWEHGDCSGNRIVGFEDFLMMAGNFGFSRGERPDGVAGLPRGRFQGGRPDNVEGGANRKARVLATIDRLRAAVEDGNLPEGVTVEQVHERIAALENALVTGARPDGERPEGVERPNRGSRPDGVTGGPGQRPEGIGRSGIGGQRPLDAGQHRRG